MSESFLAGAGEAVRVLIHHNDQAFGTTQYSSHEMVNSVVEEMFVREGIEQNHALAQLCVLAARIAVAKLASSPGFTIELGGDLLSRNPREIIYVKLRPDSPVVREAEVTTQTQA
ncbi:MAG TPA: hypothetical protein VLE69_03345 [Candidatus Saccharimonadales bacterium]|nr:hypothetical protein [Candidatus Saccharimonadales bacterium]